MIVFRVKNQQNRKQIYNNKNNNGTYYATTITTRPTNYPSCWQH